MSSAQKNNDSRAGSAYDWGFPAVVAETMPVRARHGAQPIHWCPALDTCASLPNSQRAGFASVGSGARKITGLSGGIGRRESGIRAGKSRHLMAWPYLIGSHSPSGLNEALQHAYLMSCRVHIPASIPKIFLPLAHWNGAGGQIASPSAPKLMEAL